MIKNDVVRDMEHWATVADDINRYWAEVFAQYQSSDENEITLLSKHMVALTEIVADLARQQASTFKAIRAAHNAIGG